MDIVLANGEVIERIVQTGLFDNMCLVEVPRNRHVEYKVSMHTDLSIYVDQKIHIAPSLYPIIYEKVKDRFGTNVCEAFLVKGEIEPGEKYPADIAYNILRLDAHLFHLLKHSERTVLMETNLNLVNVNQGYSRCSCMPIGKKAIITEDRGLGEKVVGKGYDVLFIERGHVVLEGYPYGFFGGTGGQVGDNIILNGSLSNHPEGDRIRAFIQNHGFMVVELHDGKLIDCGSVLHFHRKEE